ncbi:MAG: PleD family two-component system response regulator [Roseomonas sp.]|nr:PleD family two-component system response regulator [Roseomonas sp.]MCA3286836.1 PleD family two-component system response regulator [Roseomonas sp.]MCA3289425.1 PleD family two-component system response regulator [Roseomonas sp.]MCA3294216.1 PleD family two-component system response regulator [Roseomonas sp.]MCA3340880.1 PleD family two-component system response regulator [Roseomonas sp.]
MTARVLVVDDSLPNRKLLEARLQDEYFEVLGAASAAEAITLAQRWSPDIILLDVLMPVMDGFEACRRLKAQPATAHIPVVMVTSLNDQSERVRGLDAGADDFLVKPVDQATLFARLRALLRVKQVLDAWRLRAETVRDLGFEPPSAPPEEFEGAKVLLLSDNVAEAAALSGALAADGMALEQFRDEKTVWARLQDPKAHYDLVLTSLPMPEGDPLRLASRLRAEAETRDLPLMLIADDEQRDLVLRAFELGASDHVLRPINEEELRARVRNQVRRRRYQLRLRAEFDRSLELAVTDGLTGLRNRRYVFRHLESLLRAGTACGVLMIDVDRFKPLNDYYGHAAGDAALREVAARLREHVRASDIVARYGGEEFLVVMSGAGAEETAVIAERLRVAIGDRPIDLGQAKLPVTVSIGSALAGNMTEAEALIAAADVAMYRAKALGRNRVEAATAADLRLPK